MEGMPSREGAHARPETTPRPEGVPHALGRAAGGCLAAMLRVTAGLAIALGGAGGVLLLLLLTQARAPEDLVLATLACAVFWAGLGLAVIGVERAVWLFLVPDRPPGEEPAGLAVTQAALTAGAAVPEPRGARRALHTARVVVLGVVAGLCLVLGVGVVVVAVLHLDEPSLAWPADAVLLTGLVALGTAAVQAWRGHALWRRGAGAPPGI